MARGDPINRYGFMCRGRAPPNGVDLNINNDDFVISDDLLLLARITGAVPSPIMQLPKESP